MRSLLTATEVATVLGVKDSRAARDTLRRWGVKPISRGPGRSGENAYPADLVWHHQQHRPGRGWRKGQAASNPNRQKEHTMQAVVRVDQAAHLPGYVDHAPWYSDHREVVSLASVLVDADWLSTPRDVVYFFEKPWKWNDQFKIWAAAGRPLSPSPDDLTEARSLGRGTMRRELERRYQDDTARWDAFVESLASTDARDELDESDLSAADHATSNVRSLKSPRQKRDRD